MMHLAALVSLLVLIGIGYRYYDRRGALQQLAPVVRELRRAWTTAPHPQRRLAVATIAVTLLGIAIGLSFMPWRALLGPGRRARFGAAAPAVSGDVGA